METRNLVLNMFTNTPSTRLNAFLTVSSNLNDAVDLLLDNEKPTLYSLDEVLKKFQRELIQADAPMQHLVVKRKMYGQVVCAFTRWQLLTRRC